MLNRSSTKRTLGGIIMPRPHYYRRGAAARRARRLALWLMAVSCAVAVAIVVRAILHPNPPYFDGLSLLGVVLAGLAMGLTVWGVGKDGDRR